MTPPPGWQALLQEYLDGDGVPNPPEVVCDLDREAVERLLAGLDRLARPAPPVGLAARITASLHEEVRDQRRHRRRRFAPAAGLVAAASLLLMLGMRIAWPARDDSPPPTLARMDTQAEPFRDSIGRAGTALTSLTTRSAETTVENTSSLLPLVNTPAIPPMPEIEPPLESFREASTGVATGLAPVTDSAQRAVYLFMRDLPFRSTPHKPG
jgi:hypothetical protein